MRIVKKVIHEDGHMDIPSAIRKCKVIIDGAQDIMEKLGGMSQEQDDLPSWWMDKVTLATDYINKADDYINNSGQINDASITEGSNKEKPTQQCGGDSTANCNAESCTLHLSITPDGFYSDGTPKVNMEYQICGTGVFTLHRNNGQFVFSVDTCDTSFNSSGSMGLPIALPSSNYYVDVVRFVGKLVCDNGQVVTRYICLDGTTLDKVSCKKKLPNSPNAITQTKSKN